MIPPLDTKYRFRVPAWLARLFGAEPSPVGPVRQSGQTAVEEQASVDERSQPTSTMPSEEEIQRLEEHIPELARLAFQKAYADTLAAGIPAVVRRGDVIVRVFPDGREEIIKPVGPLVRVQPGLKVRLR